MIQDIKKNLKLFEKIRNSSTKKMRFKNYPNLKREINSLEAEWAQLKYLISQSKVVDPNDIETIKNITFKICMVYGDLDSICMNILEIIVKLQKKFRSPSVEDSQKFNDYWEKEPLFLEKKLEDALDELRQLKNKQEFFKYNSIFNIECASDGFIAKGSIDNILHLNRDLEIINNIQIVRKTNYNLQEHAGYFLKKIDSDERIYVAPLVDTALLFYYDHLTQKAYEIFDHPIHMASLGKIYYWQEEEVIFCAKGTYYAIKPSTNMQRKVSDQEIQANFPEFYTLSQESLNYEIISAYTEESIFIYQDADNLEIGVRNTCKDTTQIIKYYNGNPYSLKLHDDYLMFFEKKRIEIRKGNYKQTIILPDPDRFFLDANFFKHNGRLYAVTLDTTNYFGLNSSISHYEIADSIDELDDA